MPALWCKLGLVCRVLRAEGMFRATYQHFESHHAWQAARATQHLGAKPAARALGPSTILRGCFRLLPLAHAIEAAAPPVFCLIKLLLLLPLFLARAQCVRIKAAAPPRAPIAPRRCRLCCLSRCCTKRGLGRRGRSRLVQRAGRNHAVVLSLQEGAQPPAVVSVFRGEPFPHRQLRCGIRSSPLGLPLSPLLISQDLGTGVLLNRPID